MKAEDFTKRVERTLGAVTSEPVEGKRMFGGVGYMIRGNMACGVHRERLIVRVGPERFDAALAQPEADVFDITGRPMKGWVMIDAARLSEDDALRDWVAQGVSFARSLSPK